LGPIIESEGSESLLSLFIWRRFSCGIGIVRRFDPLAEKKKKKKEEDDPPNRPKEEEEEEERRKMKDER